MESRSQLSCLNQDLENKARFPSQDQEPVAISQVRKGRGNIAAKDKQIAGREF